MKLGKLIQKALGGGTCTTTATPGFCIDTLGNWDLFTDSISEALSASGQPFGTHTILDDLSG